MILGADHKPIPPVDIVRRLKQIDPRLGLVFGETVDRESGNMRPAWGLSMEWLPSDRRHALVQAGDLPLDGCFDVLAYLPADCGVDEAYGYVVRTFRQMNGREDIHKLLERVHTFNRQAEDRAQREPLELLDDLLETNRSTLQGGSKNSVSAVTHHPKESKKKQDDRLREYLDQ